MVRSSGSMKTEQEIASNEMRHAVIPIALLDGHRRNYRSHPEPQIQQLVSSLQRFNQVRSIVVKTQPDGRYTILAGHGVVSAAERCNLSEMHCDVVPDAWDEMTCSAYLAADNLHAMNAVNDDGLLAKLLEEQQEAGYDLASLGTDDEALRQLLASLDDEVRETLRVSQERLTEVSGERERLIGTTPEQYLDAYNATGIRQIVLIYSQEEYAQVLRVLAFLRKQEHLETNTDAMTLLLHQYASEHAIEWGMG